MTTQRKIKQTSRPGRFKATREHHSSEAAEDYTELIADLIESKGTARTCDIAKELGISHVTAIRTLRRLQEEGYLSTGHHQPVTLTVKGKRTAADAKERHELLVNFFVALGVPRHVAEVDVEGAEHHISPTSLRCIRRFMGSR